MTNHWRCIVGSLLPSKPFSRSGAFQSHPRSVLLDMPTGGTPLTHSDNVCVRPKASLSRPVACRITYIHTKNRCSKCDCYPSPAPPISRDSKYKPIILKNPLCSPLLPRSVCAAIGPPRPPPPARASGTLKFLMTLTIHEAIKGRTLIEQKKRRGAVRLPFRYYL